MDDVAPAAAAAAAPSPPQQPDERAAAIAEYRRVLVLHAEADARARALRDAVRSLRKDHDKTEDDLKALQSVGQIIGEVLRQLDAERCECWWSGEGAEREKERKRDIDGQAFFFFFPIDLLFDLDSRAKKNSLP
jgi:hypothetical protein